jgi:hypothetical protein
VKLAGLVLRFFGMRLSQHHADPLDEFRVGSGAFRTADPPPPDPPFYAPPQRACLRLWTYIFGDQFSAFLSTAGWIILTALTASGVAAIIWGVYYLIMQDVPDIVSYPLTPAFEPDGRPQIPWVLSLPFAVSRWWDVAYAALWAVAASLLLLSFREAKSKGSYLEEETGAISFGILIAAALGGAAGICVATKGGTDQLCALATWQGGLSIALSISCGISVITSVLVTFLGGNLATGLRTAWSISLLAGLVAIVTLGASGGLLFGFGAGIIGTLFCTLFRGFLRLIGSF